MTRQEEVWLISLVLIAVGCFVVAWLYVLGCDRSDVVDRRRT
jgi:hypothetical protein